MQYDARHHKEACAHEKHEDMQLDIALEHAQTPRQSIYFIRNTATGVARTH
jgi:hypothetical protein